MKCAVIDIGSNTIRLCAYEVEGNDVKMFANERVMALLGSCVQDGALTETGIKTACDALLTLKKKAEEMDVQVLYPFATAALRNISNSDVVLQKIKEETGLEPDILSGEEEALLTFGGMAATEHIRDGLIADVGGGSTEIIIVKDGEPTQFVSFPIGSLTAFVRFIKKRPADLIHIHEIRDHVKNLLQEAFTDCQKASVLYGIGGAARTAYELEKNLYPSSGGAIQTLEMLLFRLSEDEKLAEESILKASPERLDTALPGVAILCEVAHFFGCKRLAVCQAGVREGYLVKRLSEAE